MKITEIAPKPKEQKTLRVAAYARVSSDKDAAFHSLEAQTDYYQQYVHAHPDWELVDIYSDNGISGTIVERPEFQRMLQDCRDGKIDLVITKSVTRFARNTVILLETIRELKALGVDTYFEKEDMHGISPDGELLLTLLAMYAEEEARSASENQKWRIRKMFEEGRPNTGNMLGYRLVDGKLTIVPEEAEIVRTIFHCYLSGMGRNKIAKMLMENGILPRKSTYWAGNTVLGILTNEKYTGNMLLQKTYREDFRTKKKKYNHGKLRQYYVENSHEPIIGSATFEAVQMEIKKRSTKYIPRAGIKAKPENLFCGLVLCGMCGQKYCRKNSNGKYSKIVWICQRYFNFSTNACSSQKIPETILIEKTKAVLETDTLTRNLLSQKLKAIIVPQPNCLQYIFRDGSAIDVEWHYPSRKLSWTDEMRQSAREKALAQHRKEEK